MQPRAGRLLVTVRQGLRNALEARLGLVLCRRGRGGFALTPEGAQVYEAALNLLSATDVFRSRLHDVHRRLGGDLHVAVFEKAASNPHGP